MGTIDGTPIKTRAREIYQAYGARELVRRGRQFAEREAKRRVLEINTVDNIVLAESLKRLHSQMPNESDPETVLQTARSFAGVGTYESINPMQNDEELLSLIHQLESQEPEVIVEIGSKYGGTLYTLTHSLESVTHVVSLDIDFTESKQIFFKNFSARADIRCLSGNSQTEKMRDRVLDVLPSRPDFILIDGDHRYDGVKRDWNLYRDIVADSGLIAFHDIVSSGELNGVPKLWNEIQEKYETTEFIDESENTRLNKGGGIGLVQLE